MSNFPVSTKATRVEWVHNNLPRFEKRQLSYTQIARELRDYFGEPRLRSEATIGRYLSEARKLNDPTGMSAEAEELLKPENFPEWRSRIFNYTTSRTQHALFYVLRSLALKETLPDWVIAHFNLPEDIDEQVMEAEKLMTFILLMAPRHGKTMTMVHGLINLYCQEPDLRVIYCQGIATTTSDICQLIMLEMEDNPTLIELYGPFRSDSRQWSRDNGFVLAKRQRHSITPSFLPVGITSNVRSRDADVIVIDDPQDLTRASSEATTSADYNKITTEFMTRREPHTPVLMVGSHVPTLFGDVFTQIEDNLDDIRTAGQEIIINKRKAHDDENCKVFSGEETEHWDCLEWPEYRTWDFLMAMRAMLGPELYEAVYQQDNRIEGTKPFDPVHVKGNRVDGGILDFTRSWKLPLSRCATEGCTGTLYGGLGFDPAAGEGKQASFTAISFIQGCNTCQSLYLIDYESVRVSPDRHPSMFASWAESYKNFIHMARIEINAYQKALARNDAVRNAARANNLLIDEWNTDDRKNTPEFGIPLLANYVRDGKFSVPAKTDVDRDYGRELEKSLIRYPKKPNDIPMSIWLAAGAVWMLWGMYQDLEPIYLKHRDRNVPAYMIDQPLRINLGVLAEQARREQSGEYFMLEDVGR